MVCSLSGHEVACCLWGKYAAQFETVKEANDESIICLIRFVKISEYRGKHSTSYMYYFQSMIERRREHIFLS